MRKSFTRAAVLAATLGALAAPAIAEGEFSGNVTLTSDYVFRGITQTDGAPMVQGGFDYANARPSLTHLISITKLVMQYTRASPLEFRWARISALTQA